MQCGTLACSVGADKRYDLMLRNIEADPAHGLNAAVSNLQVTNLQEIPCRSVSSFSEMVPVRTDAADFSNRISR